MLARPLRLAPLAVLLAAAPLWAQGDAPPERPAEVMPSAYTPNDLRKLYVPGLTLRYTRTTTRAGRATQEFVCQTVLEAGSKAYLLRTLTFDNQGVASGPPREPQPIPYQVDESMFRSAKRCQEAKLRLGSGAELQTLQFSYQVDLGGHPGWRHVWYSVKYPGLVLKSLQQPSGDFGKKNHSAQELIDLPEQLGGAPLPKGAPQGHLPWSDAQIMATWKPGAQVEFEVQVAPKSGPKRSLRLTRTLRGFDETSYLMEEELSEGKQGQRSARPKLWVTWLEQVRRAPASLLQPRGEEVIQAAGQSWVCYVYTLKQGQTEVSYALAKDVPGLTVRHTSSDPAGRTTRLLSAFRPAGAAR